MEEINIITGSDGDNYEIELYAGLFCGWGCSDNTDGWICPE